MIFYIRDSRSFKHAKSKNKPKRVPGVFPASSMAVCCNCPPPMYSEEKALETRLLSKPGDIVRARSAKSQKSAREIVR